MRLSNVRVNSLATVYYGVKLSGNVVETPEGYLVFKNAVIARTGFQTYKGKELPQDELEHIGVSVNPDDDVNVYRTSEEVFSKRTIASFEGKPVTDRHQGMVDVDTHSEVAEGHMQNVRDGSDTPLENGDLPLLADIFVTSRNLIAKWNAGIRELSCGYNYHLAKSGNNILQVDITGNHVAFVENGRAGVHVKVNDSKPIEMEKFNMSNFLKDIRKRGFLAWATDAKPEEVAAAFDEMAEEKPKTEDADTAAADAKAADKAAARDRLHKALDKHLDAKDSAAEEQMVNDEADMEELKTILTTPSAEHTEASGADGKDDDPDAEGNDTKEDEEEVELEKTDAEDGLDSPGHVTAPGDRPQANVPSATDAAYRAGAEAVLKALKPFVARAKSKSLTGAFDTSSQLVKSGAVKGKGSYGAVARSAATGMDAAALDNEGQTERKHALSFENAYAESRKAKMAARR